MTNLSSSREDQDPSERHEELKPDALRVRVERQMSQRLFLSGLADSFLSQCEEDSLVS